MSAVTEIVFVTASVTAAGQFRKIVRSWYPATQPEPGDAGDDVWTMVYRLAINDADHGLIDALRVARWEEPYALWVLFDGDITDIVVFS